MSNLFVKVIWEAAFRVWKNLDLASIASGFILACLALAY